jgi:hypothetical protein
MIGAGSGGASYALESLEPSFQQDLNRDGLIGALTPNEFWVPTSNAVPFSIALGPDGNLWFTEVGGNKIGEITPSGAISEFAWHGNPGGIASDGTMLWFTEIGGNAIDHARRRVRQPCSGPDGRSCSA